jgi:hypothetical protein
VNIDEIKKQLNELLADMHRIDEALTGDLPITAEVKAIAKAAIARAEKAMQLGQKGRLP